MTKLATVAAVFALLGFSGPALAQQFTNEICVQVSPPVDNLLFVVAQVIPPTNLSIVGQSTSQGAPPVYGSGYIDSGQANFALTVGAEAPAVNGFEPRPTLFLRGSIDLGTGQGSGLCEQYAGADPCGERSAVTFSICVPQ
jgi:hypothetical protein